MSIPSDIKDVIGQTLPADCPQCQTPSAPFTTLHGVQWQRHGFDLFLQCGHCRRGISMTFALLPSPSTVYASKTLKHMVAERRL